MSNRWSLANDDMLVTLQKIAASKGQIFDSVVTDPPYHLTSVVKRFGGESAAPAKFGTDGAFARASAGFMGQQWDGGDIAYRPETWRRVYDVMKPGAFLVAFGGTRTYHRMACAIEDAGFEIRDSLHWIYGCLDEETEAATPHGTEPYHRLKAGDLVLCYDTVTGAYGYQPVQEVVVYDYDDTAFRLTGDFGEQVVSRNHRCIVERGGEEVFVLAEEAAREREVRVPVLESLRDLQRALSDAQPCAGASEQELLAGVRVCSGGGGEESVYAAAQRAQGKDASDVLGMRHGLHSERETRDSGEGPGLQLRLQRSAEREGVAEARAQGPRRVERGEQSRSDGQLAGSGEPVLERGRDLSQAQGTVRGSADQIRSVSGDLSVDGASGRLRHGASFDCCASNQSTSYPGGDGASSGPRRNEQRSNEPHAVRDERAAQGIRAWRGHRTSVVRIVPIRHVGKVWCLRVPTGSFVAVRRGVAFPTGNSGFPKSHNIGKAIDAHLGAKRTEVVGEGPDFAARANKVRGDGQWRDGEGFKNPGTIGEITAPATPEAAAWEGWGTALKPAFEPIILARKPPEGTNAENVLRWGCGGLNIEACRVEASGRPRIVSRAERSVHTFGDGLNGSRAAGQTDQGRFPPNILHDGSPEVLEAFARFGESRDGVAGKRTGTSKIGPEVGSYTEQWGGYGGGGTAARFFPALGFTEDELRFHYSGKAGKGDRAASKHPTVKPQALMRWLCRLVTPPNGLVLDPFAGSGSTGQAAVAEGFRVFMIERERQYADDIRNRMSGLRAA